MTINRNNASIDMQKKLFVEIHTIVFQSEVGTWGGYRGYRMYLAARG
jgi:hypothetical protein